MVLYLSVVLLATFAALPVGEDVGGSNHASGGVHGLSLVGLIWGTTIGLALAHWFAFRLTARAFGGGSVTDRDVKIGLAQLGGAAFVAAASTVPVLAFNDGSDVQATTFVPALIVGVAGFLVAKAAGWTKFQSLILSAVVMLVGLTVAVLKNFLAGY